MDAGGPMEYEFGHEPQDYPGPLLQLGGFGPPRSGSRCPARATWGAARPEWQSYHRSWNPHNHASSGPLPDQHTYTPLPQWSLHGPTRHAGESSSRSSESSHNQDAGFSPSTSAHPDHAVPAPAPPQPAPADSPPSSPPAESTSQPGRIPPIGTSGDDGHIRPAGLSSSPSASHIPPFQGEASGWRRVLDSPPPSFVRVRLPAPSDHRSRQRPTSHQPGRVVVPGGLRGGSGGTGGPTATSPISSPDEDSDPGAGTRHLPMMNYMHSTRQSQILRGQMTNKKVASKKAIQSLQEVDLDSLPDNERTCVICYNDFGVASPEGTVETPLRLPKCKHVFGNKCILKWLEDSFSCPYCRDKLDSELARPTESMIRRIIEAARGDSDFLAQSSTIRRMIAAGHGREMGYGSDRAHVAFRRHRDFEANRESATRGERRAAPPEDPADIERRLRPRHETFHGSRTATLEPPYGTASRPSPPIPAAQPQSPGHLPSSYRSPMWQHGRHVESPPLFMAPQMAPSPGYMLYAPAGTQQPSAPPSLASPFAPLPPPNAMPSSNALPSSNAMPPFPHMTPIAQNHQIPPMQSRDDYYNAPYTNWTGLGPAAGSGQEHTYGSIPVNPPTAQLPGFPEFMQQLPPGFTFHAESYQPPQPPPNQAPTARNDGGPNGMHFSH